jgi:undecaprenyl-diphosphatase
MAIDLHRHPPMTLARLRARHAWILPAAILLFTLLAIGAAFDKLPWDQAITDAAVDARTGWLLQFARRISFMGSTPVVFAVSALAALFAVKRCPRLALAIVVVALARPVIEWGLKELIDRPRPTGDQLVRGRGPSFPSGHPLATAASWGMLPLVAALYLKQRAVWWAIAISVWVLAVLVAASRVFLGVHWASDVVASLLLAIIGVAAVERVVESTHGVNRCEIRLPRAAPHPDATNQPPNLRDNPGIVDGSSRPSTG